MPAPLTTRANAIKEHPLWGFWVSVGECKGWAMLAGIRKAAGKFFDYAHSRASGMLWESALSVCTCWSGWSKNIPQPLLLARPSQGAGKCYNLCK